MNGRNCANAITPTAIGEPCGYAGDFVSSRTNQASAIRCIHEPICDVSWPAKKRR